MAMRLFSIIVLVLLGAAIPVKSIRVNITNFRNCDLDPSENLEQYVSFTDISYEFNSDGLCDIVHGTYNIPTVNTADKLMNITMLRCKAGTTGPCNDNAEHFLEVLHCERFHKDASGPWFMLSDGMTDAKCGEKTGVFHLRNARLKVEYLTNYMVHDADYPRHRMIHMMHKTVEGSDGIFVRGCIDMEFTVLFD